jgi:RNA polymerase sigma factor (TIGR02999 family)
MELVYRELHAIAERTLGNNPASTLQATALLHEAYLRLAPSGGAVQWNDRKHFLSVSAKAMRCVLLDRARRRTTRKRGDGAQRVDLDHVLAAYESRAGDMIELDDALQKLNAHDPELVRIVELRFFAGASVEETARVLEISESTVVRGTNTARVWLTAELAR